MTHILSLSYGKDSLACLEACKLLGYPIDRVIHAEVWATQDIPADLPPMVEFKKKADAIIKEKYGLIVEHISAQRERVSFEDLFYEQHDNEQYGKHINGFPKVLGGWCKRLKYGRETDIRGYILSTYAETQSRERERFTDSQCSRETGVRAISNNGLCNEVVSVLHRGTQDQRYYGFPISVRQGNWCTALKQRVFQQLPCTRS